MMRRILLVFTLALCMISLPAMAQEGKEMRWENITLLNFVAKGGADQGHALQQYLLFDEAILAQNGELIEQYETVANEYFLKASESASATYDATIADFKKILKEHPEMAAEINQTIKELEALRNQSAEERQDKASKAYTYDPAELLRKLTSIAVNKKAYTGYKDIGGGLFAVKTGLCYGPFEPSTFNPVQTDEKDKYTWGLIDYDGRTVLPSRYGEVDKYIEKKDIIFLQLKGKDGSIRSGACGYDGRVRIPFIYDFRADLGIADYFCVFSQKGKYGFVDFDGKEIQPIEYSKPELFDYGWSVSKDGKNHGVIDWNTGRLVIPLKYKAFWGCGVGEINMLRFDNMIDVYDKAFKFVRTTNKED